jgi:SAM-dependent methyltransferase
MAPTTDSTVHGTPSESFYNDLAADYDAITGFDRRFQREEPAFRSIIDSFGIRTALDAGCGTGFHALLLARLGVQVTAIDSSAAMVQRAMQHARDMNLVINVIESDFARLSDHVPAGFDAVFCLGNTLPHLLSSAEVIAALGQFHSILKPGGLLVLQTLNYDSILSLQKRIIGVTESGANTYVRFYDFLDDGLRFNILTISRAPAGISHSLRSILLCPVRSEELLGFLVTAGFESVQLYGSMKRESFEESSSDIVIFARKQS